MRCAQLTHNRFWRSFDGGINYRDHGRITGCECDACRKARQRSINEHVARELPAYLLAE